MTALPVLLKITGLVFEAGSNENVIEAYLCLQLVDEGKLSLDDKIAQYPDPFRNLV